MDYKKIGDFISAERKSKKLTQAKLAEKIFVSEKTISKWENGNGIPDTNSLLKLCEVFEVSLNELLSGERNLMKNNDQNEKLILSMTKEIEQKNKTIWKSMWIILIVSMIGFLSVILLSAYLIPEGIWQYLSVIAACIIFIVPCFYALKLEVNTGVYKCKKCGHEFVEKYSKALFAMHFGTTRYLKCPECKKHSWCKKKIN